MKKTGKTKLELLIDLCRAELVRQLEAALAAEAEGKIGWARECLARAVASADQALAWEEESKAF